MFDLTLIDLTLYLLTGACAGFAAGLLGVGGGLIIVPVLFFIFSAQAHPEQQLMQMALATSLATIVFTSISSARAHHKKHAVIWPLVFLLTPGIIIGAWLGGLFAASIDSDKLKVFFAAFELLVAIKLLVKKQPAAHSERIKTAVATSGGIVIGFVSSIVGIGGGTLTVPFLHWFDVRMQKAVATSAACGFPIALFATLSYLYASYDLNTEHTQMIGYIHLPALFFIAGSSFTFAPLGARVAHNISEKGLRITFSLILFLLAAVMFLS